MTDIVVDDTERRDVDNKSEISILREFRPLIFNIVSYLIGIHNLPIEYGDNIELKANMNNGILDVKSVYCWMDEKPQEGYISRTENNKKILYNGNNLDVPSYYLEILNFMLSLLNPKIGVNEDEIVYEKYFIGRRLYVYGINDTTRNYYWYGDGGRILQHNSSDEDSYLNFSNTEEEPK